MIYDLPCLVINGSYDIFMYITLFFLEFGKKNKVFILCNSRSISVSSTLAYNRQCKCREGAILVWVLPLQTSIRTSVPPVVNTFFVFTKINVFSERNHPQVRLQPFYLQSSTLTYFEQRTHTNKWSKPWTWNNWKVKIRTTKTDDDDAIPIPDISIYPSNGGQIISYDS